MSSVSIERGDITKVSVDAIVNAANPIMLGGGGVDGAIHDAAGPELLEACRRIPAVNGIRCPFGEARITPGFALPARYVIHTVGPIYRRDPDPEATLRSAYAASLALARDHGLRSIAFPAISTGAYGFPLEPAARIALTTARGGGHDEWRPVERVRFVLFSQQTFEVFAVVAAKLGGVAVLE
jgi:O-acetyl-ADP-ribose deacetylase (regulator of RNase III)